MADYRPTDCLSTCSTIQATEGMMRDIGKENQTYGHFKHWLTGASMESIPMNLFGKYFAEDMTKQFNEL